VTDSIFTKNNLALIFLAAPGNSKKRINYLSQIGNGFIYTVARTGITGKKTEINEDVEKWLSFVRENSEQPIAVGFGIKSSKQIEDLSPYCDIAIAGSYFVKEIASCHKNNLNIQEELRKKEELLKK
jgi:tryptophan synthase alpha chain